MHLEVASELPPGLLEDTVGVGFALVAVVRRGKTAFVSDRHIHRDAPTTFMTVTHARPPRTPRL